MTTTREEWMHRGIELIKPMFTDANHDLPINIRVAMGFPSTRALTRTGRRIGECWPTDCATDGSIAIFVSPLLSDEVEILGVLVHELVHAVLPTGTGHRAPFKRLATKLGLVGKMTATQIGDELRVRLGEIARSLGKLPHAALNPVNLKIKRQSTRLLKAQCPTCGYTVRVTAMWLDKGNPRCPDGDDMIEDGEDDE